MIITYEDEEMKISIEQKETDDTFDDFVEHMLYPLSRAIGFTEETVVDGLGLDE